MKKTKGAMLKGEVEVLLSPLFSGREKREAHLATSLPGRKRLISVALASVVGLAFGRFGATDHQQATEKFPVVKFNNGPLGFVHRTHGDKPKSLGFFRILVGDNFRIANRPNPIKELEEIILGGIE